MTKSQLNRDVKRLANGYTKALALGGDDYYAFMENGKLEFKRLFRADPSMNSLTQKNVLRMVRLQCLLQAQPHHVLGMHIELDKL
jgi:hypothetical protein